MLQQAKSMSHKSSARYPDKILKGTASIASDQSNQRPIASSSSNVESTTAPYTHDIFKRTIASSHLRQSNTSIVSNCLTNNTKRNNPKITAGAILPVLTDSNEQN